MQREKFYTLSEWRVDPEREEEFVAAWKQLTETFGHLPDRPLWGKLIRSLHDPTLFYSFGPWPEHENIMAMQSDERAQEAYRKVREICISACPGVYEVLAEVDY